eukprot:COSAG03_NODE_28_length_18724_cov_10.718128_4_plen_92_part_00
MSGAAGCTTQVSSLTRGRARSAKRVRSLARRAAPPTPAARPAIAGVSDPASPPPGERTGDGAAMDGWQGVARRPYGSWVAGSTMHLACVAR